MKFRVRPGFKLFESPSHAVQYECSGPKSGIRPAEGGSIVSLNMEQVSTLAGNRRLGGLEPIDAEAIRAFGHTEALVSSIFTHPERHAIPAEPARVEHVREAAR